MTSARRLENIAKRIVRDDVESNCKTGTEKMFYIDEEVYHKHLPEMKENIEDSSLSDFLLKYDLGIHTTELVTYFSPQSSKKRNFANLRHLSEKYGYHLCYMALREAACEHNDNKQLVERMKTTAISMNKVPPSDLHDDSPSSSEENITGGQGEQMGGNQEMIHAEQKLDGPPIEEHMMDMVGGVLSEERDKPHDTDSRRRFSSTHLKSCKCTSCLRMGSESNPARFDQDKDEYLWSQSSNKLEKKQSIDKPLSSPLPSKYSTPQQVSAIDDRCTSTPVPGDSVYNIEQSSNISSNYCSAMKPEDNIGGSKVVLGK